MKKASLILLSIICLMATVQGQDIKNNSKKSVKIALKPGASIALKNDTTEYYKLTASQAILLYQLLKDVEVFVKTSGEITAWQATKVYFPKIDTMEKIISKQYNAYALINKAKADSLAKQKAIPKPATTSH